MKKENIPTQQDIECAYKEYLKSNMGLVITSTMIQAADAINIEFLETELCAANKKKRGTRIPY